MSSSYGSPGAFIDTDGEACFRVWAPSHQEVEVISPFGHTLLPLQAAEDGYFAGRAQLKAGTPYMLRLDGAGPWPDPCSRFQPEGPHGPSLLLDPQSYAWRDDSWRGCSLHGQVIYEMHIGAFTDEGTFDAARSRLAWLRELGITMLEVMPVAEFPGRFNWGYDGVQLFAPYHGYGDHEAFKRFVDAAHALGLGVLLDVVYNHLGPDGNYLRCFSEHYFTDRHCTEWGEALNFDGKQSRGMRDLVIENAAYWAREFHVDGLRLDATQAIVDDSADHVIAALARRARADATPRKFIVIAEDEPQRVQLVRPPQRGGMDLDGLWNDDFHHAARVALTGNRDAYFHDFTGRSQELLSAVRRGFLFQGQHYHFHARLRGEALRNEPASACVHFLQNHDQVGNTFDGMRLHEIAAPGAYRALTALLLLGPQTPLLFMGQEFASSNRFHFFVDHPGDLGRAVSEGRRSSMKRFRAYSTEDALRTICDPCDAGTFNASKLDWQEATSHAAAVALHRDLLALRHGDPVIARQDRHHLDGAVLSERAFVLRWFDDDAGDRLLLVNLDRELILDPNPEPLFAPMAGRPWRLRWSSDEPRYGGAGVREPVDAEQRWRVPAQCAIFLSAD